jgi:glycosyltransferase involved in cell wall biosynthesis
MNPGAPRFSIVIPTRNRIDLLGRCLESLARLDYPHDLFEVLVVDDGGTQPLEPLVASLGERMPLRLVRQDHAGPGAARNAGAAVARGRWLVFTDDDCEPHEDYLRRLEAHFERCPRTLLGGRTLNAHVGNLFSSASQALVDFLCAYYQQEARLAFFTSNNLALPAEDFRALGGYEASWALAAGEDRELCDRWRHRGGELAHATDAVVVHGHDLDARGFLRQHFRYGRGAYHFHRVRARDGRGRHEMEPLRFYTGLLAHPFRAEPLHRASAMSGLLVLSQVANALGFFWERRRSRP